DGHRQGEVLEPDGALPQSDFLLLAVLVLGRTRPRQEGQLRQEGHLTPVFAAVVHDARWARSGREDRNLGMDGGEVTPQTGFDLRAVVTAPAPRQRDSNGKKGERNAHRAPRQHGYLRSRLPLAEVPLSADPPPTIPRSAEDVNAPELAGARHGNSWTRRWALSRQSPRP